MGVLTCQAFAFTLDYINLDYIILLFIIIFLKSHEIKLFLYCRFKIGPNRMKHELHTWRSNKQAPIIFICIAHIRLFIIYI